MSQTSTTIPSCPECGAPLTHTAPRGLCARCLVANALSSHEPSSGDSFSLRSLEELSEMFPDFEIRRLLGRGGMGAVYEAWQKSLSRPVALKLLPLELLQSEDFFERFQREARIMAQMDHPNVARVYDNGVTEEGEAYIVMELISGEPITRYVGDRALNLQKRLGLFVQVCCGVQHAHQKGIIHRDLKPSNILVAEVEGRMVPKVIDFGLAKPLEQSSGDEAVWLSAWHAAGTPAYMSPEQAAGKNIDIRSDVYSLGALLYELLTGRAFLDGTFLQDATRTTIEATVRQTPVPRPSDGVREIGQSLPRSAVTAARAEIAVSRAASTATAGEMRGDLDAIVLKALEKDPARRYETVAAFSDDIERHLTHQPVQAVDPSACYLAMKFCRRHRTGLAVAAGFVLVLAAGLLLVVRGSVQARRAERLAEERLQQGERLIEFILGDLHAKLETVGRVDVLESAVGEVEQFYARPAATNLPPESLRNRGRARFRLGQIRNAQGKADAAKSHYEDAIRIYEAAIVRRPGMPPWKEELGRTWNGLAVFHHQRGQWAEAEAAYLEALRLADRLVEADPNHSDWANFKASLLHNFASLCEATARLEEAEKHYTEALSLWQNLQARTPENLKLIENLSYLYLNLAFLQSRRGRFDQVNESNAEALRLRERLVRLDPNNVRALALLADIQQNISEVCVEQGNYAEAERWLNRYRPVREQLAARDPGNADWQRALAEAWHNFAVLQTRRDNLDAAAAAHRKAWEISEAHIGSSSSSGQLRLRWIEGLRSADDTFSRLAQREKDSGNVAAAQRHSTTVVELRAKVANEKVDDPKRRDQLALALLDLAAIRLTNHDGPSVQPQVYLALLLLDGSREADISTPLAEHHWKLVCDLVGDLDGPALVRKQDRDSIRKALDRLAKQSSMDAVFEDDSIRWPANLAAEIRKLASRNAAKK